MIYLDNAATTFPKPFEVKEAMGEALSLYGANPGRSGHSMSVNTAMCVYHAREVLNDFFDGYGAEYVTFTQNCTHALNLAIKGAAKKGGHIVISSLEHNSVARPVFALKEKGLCDYSVFEVSENDDVTVENFKKALRYNTNMAVVTAVSNVFGNILPLQRLAAAAHEKDVLFFADGAQGAGIIPLKMKEFCLDALCVPGHKGLLGPMGTGALLQNGCVTGTIMEGGTGSFSMELAQPGVFPDRLESGTLNVPGINGLRRGVQVVSAYGLDAIFEEETAKMERLFDALKNTDDFILYRDRYCSQNHAPLLSFNIRGMHSEQVASLLNEGGVAVRGGYHCSFLAHRSFGTEECGAVRVSPSLFTSEKDINILLNLLQKIAIAKEV